MNLEQFLSDFDQLQSKELIINLIKFISWSIFILFLVWILNKTITKSVEDNTIRYRSKKLIRLFSYIIIVILGILIFTGKGQYFTIAIGLFGAGLAFALQEVILSVAGWISIFSTKSFQPGDRIEINGVKGDVIDISLTKTTLMEIGDWVKSDNYSGSIVKVNNSAVIRGNIRNYSTDFPFVWDEIDIPIHYQSDLELAQKLVKETADECLLSYASFAKEHWKTMVKKYLIDNAHVEPTLSVSLNDNWIQLNLRYVVDYKKRRITKSDLFEKILIAVNRSNGQVRIASTTVEMIRPTLKEN